MRDEIILNADEKAVLKFLHANRFGDIEGFVELSPERKSAAAKSLKANGLILANFKEGGNVVSARATNEGIAYVDRNPNLDDPMSVEIERLQYNELRYKKKIRVWQIVATILGLGDVIWLLFSLFKC